MNPPSTSTAVPPLPEGEKIHAQPLGAAIWTFVIVAGCAIFFSSKGVFAKSAYAHGADAMTVLGLRMLLATPFFLVTAWITSRRAAEPLSRGDLLKMLGLGFLGYYLSSLVNFIGLQYISAGLERILLYCYPTLVVLGGWISGRQAFRFPVLVACAVAYAGIVLAFLGEIEGVENRSKQWLGAGLVFTSAVTYACFILLGAPVVKRVGSARFISFVSGASGLMVLLHVGLTQPLEKLTSQPPEVYGWCLMVASFGTIIPSYLLGAGLKRAGPQHFAVISTIGPLMTLVLAGLLLGEQITALQLLGFLLSLVGGLAVTLMKGK